jgi:hypothetical protein
MLPEAKERFANLLPSGYSKISQPVDEFPRRSCWLRIVDMAGGGCAIHGTSNIFQLHLLMIIQDTLNLLNVWPSHQFSCHSDIWNIKIMARSDLSLDEYIREDQISIFNLIHPSKKQFACFNLHQCRISVFQLNCVNFSLFISHVERRTWRSCVAFPRCRWPSGGHR